MKIEDLTLSSIESMRHLRVGGEVISPAWYAAGQGQSEATAVRFVAALVMTDNLTNEDQWPHVMRAVIALEEAAGQGEPA